MEKGDNMAFSSEINVCNDYEMGMQLKRKLFSKFPKLQLEDEENANELIQIIFESSLCKNGLELHEVLNKY